MSTIFFYMISRKVLKSLAAVIVAFMSFIILTSIPMLEGNIPNGELFVMGFILAGTWLFLPVITENTPRKMFLSPKRLLGIGVLGSLGVLTKIPAIFDIASWFSVGFFTLVPHWPHPNEIRTHIRKLLPTYSWIFVGLLVPILLSILYYITRGAGKAYLDYGLLYNFRYAGSWQPSFPHPIFSVLFSLPAKAVILAGWAGVLGLLHKRVSRVAQWILLWCWLALLASTLSNRPYPHYFLQTIPPLTLLFGIVIDELRAKKLQLTMFLSLLTFGLYAAVFVLLGVGMYETIPYYQRFAGLMSGKISQQEYTTSFESILADNYEAAAIIRQSGAKQIFIWGTNPTLYALSGTYPVGRFTVSFHIKDFAAEAETVEHIRKNPPQFIVVMKQEVPLPGLTEILEEQYIPNNNFHYFTLWKQQDRL